MSVLVDKLVPSGQGFARLEDGRPVFVLGAYPGDRIQLDEVTEHKSYAHAERWTLLEPSPDRIDAPCSVFADCGGCDWMALAAAKQASAKRELIVESLRRLAGIELDVEKIGWVGSERQTGYRSRVRLHVDEQGRVGFFSASTHAVVPITSCLVCTPELDAALARLAKVADEQLAPLSEIHVQHLAEGVSLHLVPRSGGVPAQLKDVLQRELPDARISVAGDKVAFVRLELIDSVYTYAAPGAFSQINPSINAKLLTALRDKIRALGAKTFADLYCGSGNFALPLLTQGLRGVGVELDRGAIAAARRAAREQGLAHKSFERLDAVRAVRRWAHTKRHFDVVVVDPPRQGMKRGLDQLARITRNIAMVSCDPATLARDLRALVSAGYTLDDITAFDMFPQTHHVEVLAWLSRKK